MKQFMILISAISTQIFYGETTVDPSVTATISIGFAVAAFGLAIIWSDE